MLKEWCCALTAIVWRKFVLPTDELGIYKMAIPQAY